MKKLKNILSLFSWLFFSLLSQKETILLISINGKGEEKLDRFLSETEKTDFSGETKFIKVDYQEK